MPYSWKIPTQSGVYLTEIAAADRTSCAALLNDREIYDRLLLLPHPYSESDFDQFFANVQSYLKRDGHPISFAIRDAEGTMIGGFGFKELIKGHCATIGYWLGRPYWGRGIMTSVVPAMTAFAVQEWDLVRVAANVFPTNTASVRVLEKAGFEYEGLQRNLHKKGDQFIDAKSYAWLP